MSLKDNVAYNAQTCIRAYILAKQFQKNLPNASQEEIVVLVRTQLRGEFESLLKEVTDYLTNNPDILTEEKDHVR
jgi:hypothetical protein